MVELSEEFKALLKQPAYCHVATLMPDGSPHTTVTWADTDGTHILINTVEGYQKVRNMRRDPRVALNVPDPANPAQVTSIRGRVVEISADGAREQLEALSQRYLGRPYPFGGPEQKRLIVKIAVEVILGRG